VPVDFCKPDDRKIACLYTDVPPNRAGNIRALKKNTAT